MPKGRLEMIPEELLVKPNGPTFFVRFDDVAEPLFGISVEPGPRRGPDEAPFLHGPLKIHALGGVLCQTRGLGSSTEGLLEAVAISVLDAVPEPSLALRPGSHYAFACSCLWSPFSISPWNEVSRLMAASAARFTSAGSRRTATLIFLAVYSDLPIGTSCEV